jgi:amidase
MFVKNNLPKTDMNDLWDIHLQKWNYQCEYLAAIRAFEEKTGKELDAIIAPITATAAVRHNQFRYYGYATAINVLDFTSVVVPVTFADKTIDVKDNNYKPLTETDAIVQDECESINNWGALPCLVTESNVHR